MNGISRKEFDALVSLERGLKDIDIDISQDLVAKGFVCDGKITALGLEVIEPYRVKRAIFLAAGFGSRMVPITLKTPKPLVKVNGTRMIDTLLDAVVAAQIPEIYIVTGYLAEQFNVLKQKYSNITFINNAEFDKANNIGSAYCARHLMQNAYVMEADLVLSKPELISKYQWSTNILGIPVKASDDWCLEVDRDGYVCKEEVGGKDCYQMVGISYWDKEAGSNLERDIEEVFLSEGGKDYYWEQVAFVFKKKHYKVQVRECLKEDIVEIDSYEELRQIDGSYVGLSDK